MQYDNDDNDISNHEIGPEILNKFVGQSEENIRKLFEPAEKDYAARGEDADLHIVIFDEIDAICKYVSVSNDIYN